MSLILRISPGLFQFSLPWANVRLHEVHEISGLGRKRVE